MTKQRYSQGGHRSDNSTVSISCNEAFDLEKRLPFFKIFFVKDTISNEPFLIALGLKDTGANENLIDKTFFTKHFPEGKIETTSALLSFASNSEPKAITHKTTLNFFLETNKGLKYFSTNFLLIDGLEYKIYIGQSFLNSEDKECFNSNFTYLSNSNLRKSELLEYFGNFKDISYSKIWHVEPKDYISFQTLPSNTRLI